MYVGYRVAIIHTAITGYESVSYIGWTRLRDLHLPVTKFQCILSFLNVCRKHLSVLVLSQTGNLITVLTVFAFGQLGLCICGIVLTPAADAVLGISKNR